MKKIKFNISDRKLMFMFLCIILVSIFSLTMAYAALSVTLNIKGNAEVVASSWDIHFENLFYDALNVEGSASIIDDTSISFNTVLNKPGDSFALVVDVVNYGTIDAIIESIEKTDDLTAEQSKYLKYDIKYASGESIAKKQVLETNSYVRLKVNVEYRNDIDASDLPTSQTSLNLSFKLNYSQRDEGGTIVTNNGTKAMRIVSGDLNTPGSEVCLGNECFYFLGKEEDDKFQLLALFAKHNLNVGGVFNGKLTSDDNGVIEFYSNPTGLQDSSMIGIDYVYNGSDIEFKYPWYGVTPFSRSQYWDSSAENAYFDEDSYVWKAAFNYALLLGDQGYDIMNAYLPNLEFLTYFGCSGVNGNCEDAPEWIDSTSYWLSTVGSSESSLYGVMKDGVVSSFGYDFNYGFGVRPIIILRDEK